MRSLERERTLWERGSVGRSIQLCKTTLENSFHLATDSTCCGSQTRAPPKSRHFGGNARGVLPKAENGKIRVRGLEII
jgi:hypothetical protein